MNKQKIAEDFLNNTLDLFQKSEDLEFAFRIVFSSLLTVMIQVGIDKKTTVQILQEHLNVIPNDYWDEMSGTVDKEKVKNGKTS